VSNFKHSDEFYRLEAAAIAREAAAHDRKNGRHRDAASHKQEPSPADRWDHKRTNAPLEVHPLIVRVADVQPETIAWRWRGRAAAGKLTLLVGDPGLGKSWITLDIAARTSAGVGWPDGEPGSAPANVLLLSAEDGLADTIRPRLDALGADVRRVHHLAVLRAGEKERAVQLADIGPLEQAITETGAKLLIIDPVSAYLGSTDSHRDSEVRGLMAPLAQLADRTGTAVIGVMHLAKSQQRPAIYRAVGSIAFAAAARLVLAVMADPDRDERRIFAPVKQNICAAAPALAYSLTGGALTWERDPVADCDVEALLSGPPADRQERREADAWLREVLQTGPTHSKALQAMANEAGLSWRTIERAKARLKIEVDRIGFGKAGRWYWRLPETAAMTATTTDTETDVAAYDQDAANSTVLTGSDSKTATVPRVAGNGGLWGED